MTTNLAWGILRNDIDELAKTIEQIFDIALTARESSFLGEYYRYPSYPTSKLEESFSLQPNYVPAQEDWIEEDHKQYPCLLYSRTQRPDEIIEMLSTQGDDFVLLKRKEYKE
jgi:hypothetical protein